MRVQSGWPAHRMAYAPPARASLNYSAVRSENNSGNKTTSNILRK
jgi:hypothetical protein